MFSFHKGSNTMQTSFDVYQNGKLIHVLQFNYDVSPQKIKQDMGERDGFQGPLLVVKKPMLKVK